MIIWFATAAMASPDSLVDVVALHLRLDGRAVDQQTLAGLYGALCDDGEEVACRWRAWDDWSTVKRPDLLRLMEPGCASGNHQACVPEAWMLGLEGFRFTEEALDPARSRTLLLEACAAGVMRACSEMGVILGEDVVVDPEPIRARALQEKACAKGVVVACVRVGDVAAASKLGDPAQGLPSKACEAGVTQACETLAADPSLSADERIAVLDRVCHLGGDCQELARALSPTPLSELPEGRSSHAWVVDQQVLLRFDAETFSPHLTLQVDEVDRAEIVVSAAGDEQVVLVQVAPSEPEAEAEAEDRRIGLPANVDCTDVVAQVKGLDLAGVAVRAVTPNNRPTRSLCVDRLGPGRGPSYLAGSVALMPRIPGEDGPASTLLGQLDDVMHGGLDCLQAAEEDITLGPVKLAVQHKRSGALKAKLLQSSRSATADACLVSWLTGLDLEDHPLLPTKGTLIFDVGR